MVLIFQQQSTDNTNKMKQILLILATYCISYLFAVYSLSYFEGRIFTVHWIEEQFYYNLLASSLFFFSMLIMVFYLKWNFLVSFFVLLFQIKIIFRFIDEKDLLKFGLILYSIPLIFILLYTLISYLKNQKK